MGGGAFLTQTTTTILLQNRHRSHLQFRIPHREVGDSREEQPEKGLGGGSVTVSCGRDGGSGLTLEGTNQIHQTPESIPRTHHLPPVVP